MSEHQAYERGAEDFLKGRHVNPFDHSEQADLWRAWVKGYRECMNSTAQLCDILLGGAA